MMAISVIQQSWFRDTFPCAAELKFATLIFFGSVCNYILAVLFIYYNVYFEAASICKYECHKVRPDPRQQRWRGHIFIPWTLWCVTTCEMSWEVPLPQPRSLVDVMSCKELFSRKGLCRTYCLLVKGTNTSTHVQQVTVRSGFGDALSHPNAPWNSANTKWERDS